MLFGKKKKSSSPPPPEPPKLSAEECFEDVLGALLKGSGPVLKAYVEATNAIHADLVKGRDLENLPTRLTSARNHAVVGTFFAAGNALGYENQVIKNYHELLNFIPEDVIPLGALEKCNWQDELFVKLFCVLCKLRSYKVVITAEKAVEGAILWRQLIDKFTYPDGAGDRGD